MAGSANWSDLGIRTLSAAVLIPAVLLAVWFGGIWFELLALIIGLAIAWEWSGIVYSRAPLQLALHAAAAIAAFISVRMGAPLAGLLAIIILQAVSMLIAAKPLAIWKMTGVLYAGLPCLALLLLRGGAQYGFIAVVWCFVIVWAADILAYFAGRLIGGPKLAPSISPKKTWAGLGGAIAGAVLASLLVTHFGELGMALPLALLAAVLAVVEQAGDLFESSLKRAHGVKDSSHLIPGHGGVLDRVDGLIAVVVVACLVGMLRAGHSSAASGLMLW